MFGSIWRFLAELWS